MEGQTLLHVKCFVVQKLSQEICVPKSCRNKQTFCCLLGVYSAIFDMITDGNLGQETVEVSGGQTYGVFLEGDSREQQ